MTARPRPAASGVACVTACTQCAADVIPRGHEYEPGRRLGVIHASHVGELEADGWTVIPGGMYGDGVPDAVCPHIAPDLDQ